MSFQLFLFFAIPLIIGTIATAVFQKLWDDSEDETVTEKRSSHRERADELADEAAPKARRKQAHSREASQVAPATAPSVPEPSLQALAVEGVPEVIDLAEFSNRNVSAAA